MTRSYKRIFRNIGILISVLINSSCGQNINVNSIDIDILTEVSMFPEYEKNYKFSQDILAISWNELFKQQIEGFKSEETKELNFFINTREDEKITKIQLRSNRENKPEHYDEIRKIVLDKIEEMKVVHLNNDKFISEATNLADSHIKLLDDKDYDSFFNLMPIEISSQITSESKTQLSDYRKSLKIKSSERKFWYRFIGTIDTADSGKINLVEVHYLINNKGQQEYLVYQLLKGKTTLVGYNM